jgi:hypothetical protein
MPEYPRERGLHFYEEALSEEERERLREAAREACRGQGIEPTADVVEVVALEAAHKLLQRGAGIVSEASTPEELERVVSEELQHTPAENRSSSGISAL